MKKKRENSLVFSLGRMKFLSRFHEMEVVLQYSVKGHVVGFSFDLLTYSFKLLVFDFVKMEWCYLGYSRKSLPAAPYQWYYRHIDMISDLCYKLFIGF